MQLIKITGNSGLNDLLGVLEYGINVSQYCNVGITVCWSKWISTFDRLISFNFDVNYIKQNIQTILAIQLKFTPTTN